MSELTTERLENIANGNCGCLNETAMQMARELLSLRTDAGDDLKSGNDFLRQEIEDWKEANRRAEAERDEARKEVQLQRGAWEAQTSREKDACQRAGITFGGCDTVHDLADAVATLTAELAALKSCPEMGEIDAIEDWLEGKEIEFGVVRRIKRLVEMVGQLSAALTEERKRADEAEKGLRITVEWKDRLLKWGSKKTESYTRGIEDWAKTADRHVEKLCQQIAERDAEIERLKKESDELRQSYEFVVEQNRERIATLTAERDEARRLIRWMVNCLTIFNSGKLSVFLQNIIDDRSYPPSYRREANAILTLAEGGA